MILASAILLIATTLLLLPSAYLLVLTVLSAKPTEPPKGQERLKYVVLVPAHNEAQGIGRTVACLLALDWPESMRRILVIADNCSDATAQLAREAGAEVLERNDADLRGKGYALEYAFNEILKENWADAIVVIDADTTVSPGLLEAFNARLALGAQAVQAFSGVLNPDSSWRTRLITIALSMFHRVRSRGREMLGVSCGLRGNGMCLAVGALQQVPHRVYSLVEDLEYGIELGRAGIRVWYADEVDALGEMVSSESSARSQRQRWEGGRAQIARKLGWPLLKEALRKRDLLLFDLAMDILVPPLGTIGILSFGLALLASLTWWMALLPLAVTLCAMLPLIFLLLHLARGVMVSGLGMRGWTTLASAPIYLIWKLSLKLRARPASNQWVRTTREDTGKASSTDK